MDKDSTRYEDVACPLSVAIRANFPLQTILTLAPRRQLCGT
jgi:hypothetical protein